MVLNDALYAQTASESKTYPGVFKREFMVRLKISN